MARKRKNGAKPDPEETGAAGTAEETTKPTGTDQATGTEEGTEEAKKPTLEELTAAEKVRLEEELANKMDHLDQAIGELKDAKQLYKDCKKEAEERRASVHQTNRSLREVLRGRWRPAKPDPQKKMEWSDDPEGSDPAPGTDSSPAVDPEASSLWKSKPVGELGLSKTLVRKLENEGYTTLGVIAAEMEEGGQFGSLDFSERQISQIQSALFKYRPEVAPAPEGEGEATGDENDAGDDAGEDEAGNDSDEESEE